MPLITNYHCGSWLSILSGIARHKTILIGQPLSSKHSLGFTDYPSFEAAYKNKDETRELTEEGIAEPAKVPMIPKDFDMGNKELLKLSLPNVLID